MPGNSHIVELAANQDIDATRKFEATFAPTRVTELMLEFDPKHAGPPLVVLTGQGGAKELHPLPLRGREGRYSARVDASDPFVRVEVSVLRGLKGKLIKVKLIGKPG